jgi:sugar lactone lactonase YvrE
MTIQRAHFLSSGMVCAGMVSLLAASAFAQNLFVADYGNYKGVYEITPNGAQSNFVSGLMQPSALAFNKAGDLFVADALANSIIRITPAGVTNKFASGLDFPYGLAFDPAGNLFETDYGDDLIYEFTNHNGVLSSNLTIFASGLNAPVGLAFNRMTNLFEADYGSGKIIEFTNHNGTLSSNPTVFAAGLNKPGGLAFNGAGLLFVACDVSAGSVVKVTTGGSQSTFASGLNLPLGLAFDAAGNLFVANQGGNKIIEIKPAGTQSTFISEAAGDIPTGLAFQPAPALQAAMTNKTFQVTVTEPSPYGSTVLQASTNFSIWTNVYTNTPPFTFTDSIHTASSRFYRAHVGP